MKKTLLSIVSLMSSATFFSQCTDIFISEYVEGSGNNKAIELYNPTPNAVDLSGYSMTRFSNGTTSPTPNHTTILSGTIDAYGTYVFVLDKRDPNGTGQNVPVDDALQAKADQFINPVFDNGATFFFNGNDALVLQKGNTPIDVFGKPGENPCDPGTTVSCSGGWDNIAPDFITTSTVTGWTINHTLIRKFDVLEGENNIQPLVFDPSVEWDSLPRNTFDNLGTHDCGCNPSSISEEQAIKFSLYPNPSNTGLVTINAEEKIAEVTVHNLLGEVVYTKSSTSNVVRLNTTSWLKGMYLITLTSDKGLVSTKKLSIN